MKDEVKLGEMEIFHRQEKRKIYLKRTNQERMLLTVRKLKRTVTKRMELSVFQVKQQRIIMLKSITVT